MRTREWAVTCSNGWYLDGVDGGDADEASFRADPLVVWAAVLLAAPRVDTTGPGPGGIGLEVKWAPAGPTVRHLRARTR